MKKKEKEGNSRIVRNDRISRTKEGESCDAIRSKAKQVSSSRSDGSFLNVVNPYYSWISREAPEGAFLHARRKLLSIAGLLFPPSLWITGLFEPIVSLAREVRRRGPTPPRLRFRNPPKRVQGNKPSPSRYSHSSVTLNPLLPSLCSAKFEHLFLPVLANFSKCFSSNRKIEEEEEKIRLEIVRDRSEKGGREIFRLGKGSASKTGIWWKSSGHA